MGQSNTTIGQSVTIRGELSARENLNIHGQVDGKIKLNDHVLTIGLNRKIAGESSCCRRQGPRQTQSDQDDQYPRDLNNIMVRSCHRVLGSRNPQGLSC